MEKNIKVDEDLWLRIQQERLVDKYKRASDLLRKKLDFCERYKNKFKEFAKKNEISK